MKRTDAEKMLLQVGNQSGTFLLRDCESQPGNFTLSVRNGETITHYCVKTTDQGGFYIDLGDGDMFNSLEEVVSHIQKRCGWVVLSTDISLPFE